LLGYEHTYLGLASWSISVAYLGVFLAVPLRDHFLVQHRLKFPSGTATAECIRAAFALPPSGGGDGGGAGNSFSGSGNVEMGEMKGGDSLDSEQQQQQPEDRARKQFKSLLFAAFVSFATAMVAEVSEVFETTDISISRFARVSETWIRDSIGFCTSRRRYVDGRESRIFRFSRCDFRVGDDWPFCGIERVGIGYRKRI